MTKFELISRLNNIEWEDFEVKEARADLPKNIRETVSAFSNTSGGWIVLGVKQIGKRFEVQGVGDGEKIESDFLNTLRKQIHSMPRNPILSKLFRFARLSENAGYGIGKMLM